MASHPVVVDGQIKEMAYQRWLHRARWGLSPLERPFSRFIHQEAVDGLSEALALTFGRPLALFLGGLAAFAGSVIYYTLSLMGGYTYDYSLPLLLLAIGVGTGWLLEIVYYFLHK